MNQKGTLTECLPFRDRSFSCADDARGRVKRCRVRSGNFSGSFLRIRSIAVQLCREVIMLFDLCRK